MAAAEVGSVPIFDLLILRGAHLNAKTSAGRTAKDMAHRAARRSGGSRGSDAP